MGLVVELLGPPGAGKSTLAAALVRELRVDGGNVALGTECVTADSGQRQRLRAKAGLMATALLARPLACVRAVAMIGRSRQPGLGAVAHRIVAWLVAQGLLERARRRAGITVLDEGPLQTVWSLGLFGEHHALLRTWSQRPGLWHVSDIVVVLLPSPGELEARLAARPDPHSRIEQLAPHERGPVLRRGHRVAEEIVGLLPRLGTPTMATVQLRGDALDTDVFACSLASRLLRQHTAAGTG